MQMGTSGKCSCLFKSKLEYHDIKEQYSNTKNKYKKEHICWTNSNIKTSLSQKAQLEQ